MFSTSSCYHFCYSWMFLLCLGSCFNQAVNEKKEMAKPEAPAPAPVVESPAAVSTVTPPPPPKPTVVVQPAPKKTPKALPVAPKTAPQPVAPAPVLPVTPAVAPVSAEKMDHTTWNQLLEKHVSASGKVNYQGFKSDKTMLDAYCNALGEKAPAADWSRSEKMAYWINAYNAFTVQLIVNNMPSSILKLDGGKTWDVKRISLDGKKYSLNQIENEILRPQFKDARIHFAINCAAKSCPPILNKAFTADNLEQLLDERTRKFINDSQYNKITTDAALVSKIFDWYKADFGDLKKFLNQYSKVALGENASIGYQEYNWDLND